MPNSQEEGLGENKTLTNITNTTEQSAPTQRSEQPEQPRRRRVSRRVVRVAGAANAHVPVRVENQESEQQAPDTSTSVKNASAKSAPATSTAVKGRAEKHESAQREASHTPTRTRRRTKRLDALEFESPATQSRKAAVDDNDIDSNKAVSKKDNAVERKSRAQEAVESLSTTASHHAPAAARPMTSLLFQEPVIPAETSRHNSSDVDGEADGQAEEPEDTTNSDRQNSDRRERRSRRSREHNGSNRGNDDTHADEQDSQTASSSADEDEQEQGESRHRSRRSRHVQEDSQHESRSKRTQRLNAQERRAAAEVEHIEEDLEYDEIHYAPIDEDEFRLSRASKRRRNRGARKDEDSRTENSRTENDRHGNGRDEDDNLRDHESEDSFRDKRHGRDDDYDEEDRDDEQLSGIRRRHRHHSEGESDDDGSYETTGTRRRRRRRSTKSAESSRSEESASTPRRSRKQQYIDEITDIQGSTRLEAKRQRRRDNRRDRSRQMQLVEQDFLARRENVKREMVVREKEQHTQISVIEDDILVEHYVSDIQEVATVGNVYIGRVQNVLPSMEAAFVDIGQARNGVLYAGEVNWDTTRLEGQPRRIELAFKSGDPVLVQVTKDPIGHKGARLTSQVTLAGRFLVLVPSGGMTGVSRKLTERERTRLKSIVARIAPKDMGVIIRTAAENATEEAITKDLESLMKQWEIIDRKRKTTVILKKPKLLQGEPDVAIRVVRDIFNDEFQSLIVQGDKVYERIEEYIDSMAPDLKSRLTKWEPADHQGADVFDTWHIDGQLRKGMERQVYLPSGGSLVIDRTEAMTTIDVNTGRYIGKGKSLEETVTRCNLEASEEIARQLRLRDIGGMVMIDYVDMVMPANRDLVLKRLLECLARDRTKHQVAEVTSLGLVQMTRKRVGQGLVEAFSEECPTCKGRGFILHDEPTISASYGDPYALKGGDPFVKTKHAHHETQEQGGSGVSSPDVKAKLAKIAAAAQAASTEPESDEE
ncbi:Rne/Rng family ribonuclease [Bifidobacterium aquikefiricola]|uniref:Rne/Rng family ribonuclease n=1 Tax=Bifidobacterium TaxID=1678 RepID=UPI003857B32D